MMKDRPMEEIRTGPLPSRDPSGGREDLSGHNVAYHPLLENYQAMLKIAAIKLWL